MKRSLIIFFILLVPLLSFGQNDNPVSEDFFTDIKEITKVFQLNDHVNIIQINTGKNDSFDLAAVNDKMQLLWQTTITGYGVSAGRYKGNIAVIAATEHGSLKGNGNTYKAIILNPATGQTLLEKVIYEDNNNYVEIPQALIDDNYLKLVMRQTNVTRKLHVGIPIFFIFQIGAWSREANETQKLEIVDVNEKLEKINVVDAVVNGIFITVVCNKNGDDFVSMLNGPDIEVYRYKNGQNAPSGRLLADVSIKPNNDSNLAKMIFFKASEIKPDNLYYSLIYSNEDKDPELMIGKMDFSNNTKNSVTKVFKKDDLKQLKKTFIPINKKMDDADLGNPRYLSLTDFSITSNKIIVTLTGGSIATISNTPRVKTMSSMINILDENLQLKFQQIFPINDGASAHIHAASDKLYAVATTDSHSAYGVLDLNNGQWNNMYYLTKKTNKGFLAGNNILWFDKNFIAPYIKLHGTFTQKENVGMQLNEY